MYSQQAMMPNQSKLVLLKSIPHKGCFVKKSRHKLIIFIISALKIHVFLQHILIKPLNLYETTN